VQPRDVGVVLDAPQGFVQQGVKRHPERRRPACGGGGTIISTNRRRTDPDPARADPSRAAASTRIHGPDHAPRVATP
jgi:hypothetical protein